MIDNSFPSAYNSNDGSEHKGAAENFKVAGAGNEDKDVPILQPQAPIAPLSPYEQYNVSAGKGKIVPPMSQWGIKDMGK